ncbi:MAG TPA: hypothetical protein VKR61_26065 [Bryobacteraceae bacterium]|nr:hypothetical protein [Bryobacteraceae bacterium]
MRQATTSGFICVLPIHTSNDGHLLCWRPEDLAALVESDYTLWRDPPPGLHPSNYDRWRQLEILKRM